MPSTLRNLLISTAQQAVSVICNANGLVGTLRVSIHFAEVWELCGCGNTLITSFVMLSGWKVFAITCEGIQAKPVLVQMNTRSGVLHSPALSVTGSRGSRDVLGVFTGVPTRPSALREVSDASINQE